MTRMKNENLYNYSLQHADNSLILGQRLAEWCGHGPVLEQDIALTNISLDLIGQARMWYQYAANIQEEGKSEDDLAYLRDAWDFRNVLLVEQPNGDFAQTIFRQFLYDTFSCFFYAELKKSNDSQLQAIASKSHKETLYHIKWSGDWVIRLGDGTEESKKRMVKAITTLWPYGHELTESNETERIAQKEGYGVDLETVRKARDGKIREIMEEALLEIPQSTYHQKGGKDGSHSEHLGYILSDLQFLQRAYPGLEW